MNPWLGLLLLLPSFHGLVIYTYDSLLATPSYDFASAFEQYAGLTPGTVQVLRFIDAGAILQAAITPNISISPADILIGLDNVLQLESSQSLLIPYASPSLAYLDPSLVSSLGNRYHLLPYDYGTICLIYDMNKVSTSDLAILSSPTLTLNNIANSPSILSKLVLEDPRISSPGLAFLLWTISVYGDNSLNISGLTHTSVNNVNADWTTFWSQIAGKYQLAASWSDAANLFYDPNNLQIGVMSSYGTDPTYNFCNYNATNVVAVTSHENSTNNAWFQIEGIGIMNSSKSIPLAKAFVDWFLNSTLQSQIATHQWVYPASIEVTLPPCYFTNLAQSPSSIAKPNPALTTQTISANVDNWLSRWAIITGAPALSTPTDSTVPATLPGPNPSSKSAPNSSGSSFSSHSNAAAFLSASVVIPLLMFFLI